MILKTGNIHKELINWGDKYISFNLKTVVNNIGKISHIEDWGSGSGWLGKLALTLCSEKQKKNISLVLVDEDKDWFGNDLGSNFEV